MVATTLRMARAGAAHSSQYMYMYARGRLTTPGHSQPLRQHAQHQAWYSAGVGAGAAGVPDSSARPDLVEAVAALLVRPASGFERFPGEDAAGADAARFESRPDRVVTIMC